MHFGMMFAFREAEVKKEMAPKKAAKKAAKKAPAKHDAHKAGRDARRTFEHLGRVQALLPLTAAEQDAIALLATAADTAFRQQHYKDSADLLRAAEHLSFACIVDSPEAGQISEGPTAAIREEFEHLRERAEEHGAASEAPRLVRTIYTRMARDADSAMKKHWYRKALELARGAEALTHIHHLDDKMLTAGDTRRLSEGSR